MSDLNQFLHSSMPLAATLGIRARDAGPEGVLLELDWAPELCTAEGILHGGVIMSLADTAGATCAYLALPEGAAGTSTIESKTNFLAAVRSGTVLARASILHRGRSTIVVETDCSVGDGDLVAKTLQTQSVLWPRD